MTSTPPTSTDRAAPEKQRPFDGVIFDMDGTLTYPVLDFAKIRKEIGVSSGDLVAAIAALPPDAKKKAWDIIERHERNALDRNALQPGSKSLLTRCRKQGIMVGLLTRNSRQSVNHLCSRFHLTFDAVVTREFPVLKPHPDPVLHILKRWDMAPARTLMVGDYLHDIECGIAAGTKTCFFQNHRSPFYGAKATFVVSSMKELSHLLLVGR